MSHIVLAVNWATFFAYFISYWTFLFSCRTPYMPHPPRWVKVHARWHDIRWLTIWVVWPIKEVTMIWYCFVYDPWVLNWFFVPASIALDCVWTRYMYKDKDNPWKRRLEKLAAVVRVRLGKLVVTPLPVPSPGMARTVESSACTARTSC